MDRFTEFIANHWILSSLFTALVLALVFVESKRKGDSIGPGMVGTVVNKADGLLLDVRSDADFRTGHIAGSVCIPHAQLASRLGELDKYKGRPVVVVCNLGNTAGDAAAQLLAAGHSPVYRLAGGITAWRTENLPVVKS